MNLKNYEYQEMIDGLTFTWRWINGLFSFWIEQWKVDSQQLEELTEYEFEQIVMSSVLDWRRNQGLFLLPRPWQNTDDEFVCLMQEGWSALTGYERSNWDPQDYEIETLKTGKFFLKESNLLISQLKSSARYTLVYNGKALVEQTEEKVREFLKDSINLIAYLESRLLIFDENYAVRPDLSDLLSRKRIRDFFITSRYDVYPFEEMLAMQNNGTHFNMKVFSRKAGINLAKYELRPTAYYRNQKDELDKLFALEDIPQEIICFCGHNKTETGPIEHRLCPRCLTVRRAARESYLRRKILSCFHYWDSIQSEPLILTWVSSKDPYTRQKNIVDVCLMDLNGNVVYQSLVRFTGKLTSKLKDRGYSAEALAVAPTWESVLTVLTPLIQRVTLVISSRASLKECLWDATSRKQLLNSPSKIIEWEYVIKPYLDLKQVLNSDRLKSFEGELGVIQVNSLPLAELPTIHRGNAKSIAQDFFSFKTFVENQI